MLMLGTPDPSRFVRESRFLSAASAASSRYSTQAAINVWAKRAHTAGGLMSYGPDRADLWRRGAIYVDKVLKGAKPADLPVQQPTKFELVINLRTAKMLGITISEAFILRADTVIE